MEQFVFVPASENNSTQSLTKQELSKYQHLQNSTYKTDSFKKGINKKLHAKGDSLVDKFLSCSRIKLSKSQTLILDGLEITVLLSGFAQQLRCKNAAAPDIYLDAAGISPTLALNQNIKAKERGRWVHFRLRTSEARKIVHARRCCIYLCAHFSER